MNKISEELEEMIVEEAKMFLVENTTIRKLALKEGISKSALFHRLNNLLPNIDYNLYLEVRKVLEKNKQERSMRGGKTTREMWQKIKENNM